MKFAKLQCYCGGTNTAEFIIQLEQVESICDEPYQYFGNEYRADMPVEERYSVTFSDPHSVLVRVRSGKEYALTELSGMLLKRALPMEHLI